MEDKNQERQREEHNTINIPSNGDRENMEIEKLKWKKNENEQL